MKLFSQDSQENSRKFSQSKKPQKAKLSFFGRVRRSFSQAKKEKFKRARVFMRADKTDGFFDTANSL